MPSLRKRVSSYLRQLSFHNEPRDKKNNVNENAFVTKYLQGHILLREGPPIIYGKNPTDLPNYELGKYDSGPNTHIGCYSGPNGGLTTVKRTEKHLSVPDDDIDFIDNPEEEPSDDSTDENPSLMVDDSVLPPEWNRKSDHYFGLSDSLYDRNQVTKHKNGDPIADCFGVIARNDSAILAVADGVNWGEKASVAAKSAIHASLYYLNKTIFNDPKPFEKLTTKTDEVALNTSHPNESTNLIANTREVFVCLLRAFNCAHDLILENKGMLTTLTVAVILPLKQKTPPRIENGVRISHGEPHYVCCVCNVGDTLAYVYSQKYGIRELTKGSHDVNSNRDMRDALGALGPVDGINPELSNLTLSITTLNKGDIIMVASDGLTDNFDPNVCRFTVNSNIDPLKSRVKKNPTTTVVTASQQSSSQQFSQHSHFESKSAQPSSHSHTIHSTQVEEPALKPPVKPPRRSKNRGSVSSTSNSERSSSSVESEAKVSNLPQGSAVALQSESSNQSSVSRGPVNEGESIKTTTQHGTDYSNPLVAEFMRENSIEDSRPSKSEVKKPPPVMENKASSLRKQVSSQSRHDVARKLTPPLKNVPKTLDTNRTKQETVGYKFLKSKTSLDLRPSHTSKVSILRNDDGIPYVTPFQRYELQLLLMEDIIKNGISGRDSPITTARKLCESLVSFTLSITSAKRRTLEDQDMYFDNRNGVLVEVSNQEKKLRRKKGLEKVQSLPGKLDHVTVVAYNVGNFSF